MALSLYQWAVEEIEMAKVLIAGLGVSGQATARYLARNNIAFGLADEHVCGAQELELKDHYPDSSHYFGDFDVDVLKSYETIVLSPGIPRKQPAIAVHLLNEMALAANIDARLGGNFGTAALDLLEQQQAELYILELSSFQLESTFSLKPSAAVVLNISEDHMDRYDSIPEYIAAKEQIYKQAAQQIVNRDDIQARELAGSASALSFGLDKPSNDDFGLLKIDEQEWLAHGETALLPVSELKIFGRHNIANALAALCLGSSVNIPLASMLSALRDYRGLPHRTQWVADLDGVVWINDSKATNVGATQAALTGIDGDVVLIAGGQAKGADLTPLAAAAKGVIKSAILFGEDAAELELVLRDTCKVLRADDLPAAVFAAHSEAEFGDVVMLSPACASLDMFSSYAERGDVFARLVNGLREVEK